ncbi:hypothetical protein N9K40_02690 [Candidatus Pelagibacter sp.]|jgi:hypothetical protein|nr:hypothetical protein [Candidatus Pelagibacter sp.]
MLSKIKKPYVIYLAEVIYKNIARIKKNNLGISNIVAIEGFIGTKKYEEISSGKFHDTWFEYLKNNKFIDKDSGEKVPDETIKLLQLQKDATVKQLIKYPELYYAKSSFPLEISQRAFDFLWRMCESYELWCKETGQTKLLLLNITD